MAFCQAPGSRGGKAGKAARFMAALRAMGNQQGRDVFDLGELQVGGQLGHFVAAGVCSGVLLDITHGQQWG